MRRAHRLRKRGTSRRQSLNIQRLDHRGFHGSSVHLTRRGRTHSRFFSDRKHGGRGGALAAAERWREAQWIELYPPIRIRRFFPRNKTGEIGVTTERYRVGGRYYRRYRASWPDAKGGNVRRSFDVRKYGPAQALELAIQARRQGVEQLVLQTRAAIAATLGKRRKQR